MLGSDAAVPALLDDLVASGRPDVKGRTMGYGLGIGLIVVGLIFALAIHASTPLIDLDTLGWILVLGGVVVMAVTAIQLNTRRRSTAVRRTRHADGTETVARRERRDDGPDLV